LLIKHNSLTKTPMKALFRIFLLSAIFSAPQLAVAQMAVNDTGQQPNSSAMLDVHSTDKGFLAPRMTEGERDLISNPAVGLQIFNLTTGCLNYFFGGGWFEVCGTCTPAPPQPSVINGNSSPCAGAAGLSYSVANIPGTTYTWSVPSGWSIQSGQGTSAISATAGNLGGIIQVTPNVNCAGQPQTLPVSIPAVPTVVSAGADQLNVVGNSVVLSGNDPGVFTGAWSVISGNGGSFAAAANPFSQFTGLPETSYVLRWTISSPCGSIWDEVVISFAAVYAPGFQSFAFTGNMQLFTVPGGVNTIQVDARGGRGGNGWNVDGGGSVKGIGGSGGRVLATLNVTPGEVLEIYVGGAGDNATVTTSGAGAYNGGGNGGHQQGYRGGGGGGATDIRRGGSALNNRILAAGGGGSGSGWCTSGVGNGGAGGGLVGGGGQICGGLTPGSGGSQFEGGTANGAFGLGGTSTTGSEAASAGGGGWYGGGASNGSGGGGGSNYVIAVGSSGVTHTQGFQNGPGQIDISW